MITDKKSLLALCVAELPEEEYTAKSGVTVRLRGLKGSDALRASSIENLDENLLFVLPKTIVEPPMTAREVKELVDGNVELATELYQRSMELSNALGEAEAQEAETAKKN